MLKKIALALFIPIVLVLGYASTKPATFKYSRSTSIQAPAEKVFGLVNDLRQWPSWSPFEKLDPKMKKTLSGPPSGVGAIAAWEGNMEAGSGSMEITKVTAPTLIGIHLSMISPMKAENQVEFRFEPQADSTQVTWEMSGENNLLSRVFDLFVDCEKMVGDQFTDGLSQLKAIAEKK